MVKLIPYPVVPGPAGVGRVIEETAGIPCPPAGARQPGDLWMRFLEQDWSSGDSRPDTVPYTGLRPE